MLRRTVSLLQLGQSCSAFFRDYETAFKARDQKKHNQTVGFDFFGKESPKSAPGVSGDEG
jgi:hypothetical protein